MLYFVVLQPNLKTHKIMKTHEFTTTLNGINLNINFSVHGKYIPETRECPAEYPEVEILSVKVSDSEIDIFELLSKKQIEQIEYDSMEYYSNL